jgi:hypothetical protein
MHVVMNILRGIPGTCVALGTSSVLVFCVLWTIKGGSSKTHA